VVGGVNQAHDANGNLTSNGGLTFEYDYRNMIRRVKQGETTVATYLYDPLGRRVQKQVTGGTHRFVYSGHEIVTVYDGSNNWVRDFVFGEGIDEPLMMEQADILDFDEDQDTEELTRHFYHRNALGSVMALTDMNEAVAVSYRYDPYGAVTITRNGTPQSSDPLGNPRTFTARQLDEETGLYHYRARAYDPATGRFLQRDPVSYHGGQNLYEYADGTPTNRMDPLGLDAMLDALRRSARELAQEYEQTLKDLEETTSDIDRLRQRLDYARRVARGTLTSEESEDRRRRAASPMAVIGAQQEYTLEGDALGRFITELEKEEKGKEDLLAELKAQAERLKEDAQDAVDRANGYLEYLQTAALFAPSEPVGPTLGGVPSPWPDWLRNMDGTEGRPPTWEYPGCMPRGPAWPPYSPWRGRCMRGRPPLGIGEVRERDGQDLDRDRGYPENNPWGLPGTRCPWCGPWPAEPGSWPRAWGRVRPPPLRAR
jgi:RHS repeat-associated protein